jgi:hypothetical protein
MIHICELLPDTVTEGLGGSRAGGSIRCSRALLPPRPAPRSSHANTVLVLHAAVIQIHAFHGLA